ncbi:DUF58 domain-containing protein [Rudaeicoccus suwonensis]|uniref:Uncharacterized protein (DUF58 family) n=1 Tax=Rudaeicoccus suwonensis TaxID=657409 RepID=A0A561E903_9MICO|nr:DUF58 domain-containing protein [Rudaeicoccus suwonensis]TWE12050.1 uncharacterized protein (DUF58 family) [Rudaeicoccus suwonensis]
MALTGRLVALAALGCVVVLVHPAVTTVLWWALALGILVVVDLASAPATHTLALHRQPVTQVRMGDSTESVLFIVNSGSRTFRGAVRDTWQPSAGASGGPLAAHLPPGERTRLVQQLTPTRRGDRLAVSVTLRSRGILGLALRQRSVVVPGAVRCLPAFDSRRHLPSRLARLRQLDGRSAVRTRGQGTEFDSLRDYVDGDDVRSIDWRATARRRDPVVRTWQPERDRRLVLLLDTSRTSAGRIFDMPRLDSGLDAALLLSALAAHAGDRVTFLAGARRVSTRVDGMSDRAALLQALVTAMAPLEPALVEANWRALLSGVTATVRQRALVVLITPLEPAAIEEGLLPLLPSFAGRHRVVIASVADPSVREMTTRRDDAQQVYAAAAAERTISLRVRTKVGLERAGVTVLDEPPDVLPVALADHYLMLKRQGLL